MAGKLGMGLLETLLENLDRALDLASTTIKDAALTGFTKGTETGAITAAMSGRDIIVGPLAAGLAADSIFTLPTAASGLKYRFVYVGGAADAHDFQINTGSDTNFFIGGVTQSDTDDGGDDAVSYYSNNSSNSRINVLTPGAGTTVDVYCDGTNWFLSGLVVSTTDTGVSLADQ